MNVPLSLSTLALAVQAAAWFFARAISRAPGWRRARIGAGLAGTAALYSLFSVLGSLFPRTGLLISAWWSANLVVAAAHVAIWVWFSFSDEDGRWDTVPRSLRWLVTGQIAWTAVLCASGGAVDVSRMTSVHVEWLGVDFVQPSLTPLATLSAVLTMGILLISSAEQVRQATRGVPGATRNSIGFLIFFACAVEEFLVASGAIDFIYLAEVGYLALVIPVVAQFVARFISDAHRLQLLKSGLVTQVHLATEQRDAAREALVAEERFAALGRMAGGVGHEINNPLQILALSLEELRDEPTVGADAEAAESVDRATAAAARIGNIVAGLRTYALPGGRALERVGPDVVLRAAIDAARSALGSIAEIRADFGAVPSVLVDRERMFQACGHALDNAVRAVGTVPNGQGRVDVRTRTTTSGDAVIEIRDNGNGFPVSVLSRLGEPFVTTQPPGAGKGLGVFIIRGIVAAHGGMLELENGRSGGATLRILLPPAARD